MDFIQKIHINNKLLVLTTDAESYIEDNPTAKDYLKFNGAFPKHFRLSIEHLSDDNSSGAIIEDFSEKALVDELHDIYTPIDAGGGVVKNEDDEVLMIFRRGKWDLPKGKLDDWESIEECSVREVSEETGLEQLKLGDKICDTYHVYAQKGQNLLKRTTWYHMQGTKEEQPSPQAEENIEEAKWVPQKEIAPLVEKTYDAIIEVMRQAGVKW